MIDRKRLVNHYDETAELLARKGVSAEELSDVRELLARRSATVTEESELRGNLNKQSREIGNLYKAGKRAEADAAKVAVGELKVSIQANADTLREIEAQLSAHLLAIPNLPHPDAPVGTGEEDNVVRRTVGVRDSYPETPPHWEIAEQLGILDAERGAKIAGAMFTLLRGDGARLIRALVSFGLGLNRANYEEIVPPTFVRTDVFTGTGHLPKFGPDAYHLAEVDLWAIPTGEVPLMGMHQGELLPESALPIRYMAHTSCFRREAGSAGKDTRGMQRLHEFHKVELVKLCTEDQVDAEYAAMLADVEHAMALLELPYRVLDLCTADLGNSSERVHDIEVFAPGVCKWLEVSSVGRFSDYQTRRGNIRYRPEGGGKPRFPHAMNGSGLATPRIWAALLEHGWEPQEERVRLPAALIPYMGKPFVEKNTLRRV
ncbi:MAG: seryl-tRNA synthetase [Myxococcota bacterium]